MIKINQILKYLKKNIYLVCLIVALVYITYDKLYKNIENFEILIKKSDEHPGINQHILADLKEKEITIPNDETRQSFILKHKLLRNLKYGKLVQLVSQNEITKKIYDRFLDELDNEKPAPAFDKLPYYFHLFFYMDEGSIADFLNNVSWNERIKNILKSIKDEKDLERFIPGISEILFSEFCKVILKGQLKIFNGFIGLKNAATKFKEEGDKCKKERDNCKKERDDCKKVRDNCKKETELKSGTLRRCQEDNYKHINKGFFARVFNS